MKHAVAQLGNLPLQDGGVLTSAALSYGTYGTLNAAGDNCIVLPAYYTGWRGSYDAMIGPGKALDPGRWYIVTPDLFGGGHATSPGEDVLFFPRLTVADNVRAQYRLLFDHLGVRSVVLAGGWSMGAMQAYGWAALFPDKVERLLPWCGAAACWPINQVFLDGLRKVLANDPARPPAQGLRAFARVYAGWAYSAQFFREGLYRQLGAPDLESFLVSWEDDHLAFQARHLLATLETWASAAPGHLGPGSHDQALGRIQARTIIMPCDQDRYFTVEENALEAEMVQDAQLRVITSPFGHCAGAPGRFATETAQIDAALAELLAS
jgi:homoserine O-acetyltransferase